MLGCHGGESGIRNNRWAGRWPQHSGSAAMLGA